MRSFAAVALASLVAGCSLLVSTSGLDDGKPDAGAPPGADGGAPDSDAGASGDSGAGNADGDTPAKSELPGLVGAWLFDDRTARDTSGLAHDGAFVNGAKPAMTDRGPAMQVQGGGFMTVSSLQGAAFPVTGTLSVWFRYSAMDGDIEQSIFDSWEMNRDHMFIRHANGDAVGSIQIAYQPKVDAYQLAIGFHLAQDTWAHVVITWDAANSYGRAFLNGKSLVADNYPNAGFTPNGQHANFGERLDGFIDDIRLFNRVLSDLEIANLP